MWPGCRLGLFSQAEGMLCPVSTAFILRSPSKAGSTTQARRNADAELNLSKLAISSSELMFSKCKSCEAVGELSSRRSLGKNRN